ncbi:uncharacterized protein LOC125945222 [Dermacentor silvarum]|uniref:uncharacterized protein LOC125945222 n=1 Tax=Dermacentor silvarum TaxID=543639 RepID=UPI0021013300|nr:uncharacterized protein LOC125945222 [Dermacentor silvarum]
MKVAPTAATASCLLLPGPDRVCPAEVGPASMAARGPSEGKLPGGFLSGSGSARTLDATRTIWAGQTVAVEWVARREKPCASWQLQQRQLPWLRQVYRPNVYPFHSNGNVLSVLAGMLGPPRAPVTSDGRPPWKGTKLSETRGRYRGGHSVRLRVGRVAQCGGIRPGAAVRRCLRSPLSLIQAPGQRRRETLREKGWFVRAQQLGRVVSGVRNGTEPPGAQCRPPRF